MLARLDEFIPAGRRVVTITDPTVYALYHDTIDALGESVVIEGGERGEGGKTFSTIERICAELIEKRADRQTFILGFGGGIVTDIAGFVAAIYLRGVDCGLVATTLLAQVDAAVGGKNGVNVGGYKNMAGTFRRPRFVVCDVDVLDTLSEREFRAGLAEMIKAGVVGDAALFELLENHDLRTDKALLTGAVRAAIEVKSRIVDADEMERGERRKLNLGHTFGHAIERLTGEFNHGEAVAIGMVLACGVGRELGVTDAATAERITRTLARCGLPTATDIPFEELARVARHDKKSENGAVNFVLPRTIGNVEIRKIAI